MSEKKSSKTAIIAIVAVALALAAGVLYFVLNSSVSVTFDTQGGSAVQAVKVKKGEPVSRPANPLREGYRFDDWYLGNAVYDFTAPVEKPITLTARWKEIKYVTFLVEGIEYAKIAIENGHLMFPQAPEKAEHAFIGWKDKDGNLKTKDDEFTDNTVLKAEFIKFVPINEMYFTYAQVFLKRGDTMLMELYIKPDNWAETITYQSSDPSICMVDDQGNVTGVQAGTANVTATSLSGKTATVQVDVIVPIEYMDFENSQITLAVGESFQSKLNVTPADHTDDYVYTSSDKKIATVDSKGFIMAVKDGKCTITAAASGTVKATMTVIVDSKCRSIKPEKNEVTIAVGDHYQINYTTNPYKTNSKITFKSTDSIIATVDSKGKVYGNEGGKCDIQILADGKVMATVRVYVNEYTLLIDFEGDKPDGRLYLFYRSQNRPVYKLDAELRITEKGKDTFVPVDYRKLKLVASDDILFYNGSDNELYVTNRGTNDNGYMRVMTKTIYFTYEHNGMTIKSGEVEITIEPSLTFSIYGTGVSYEDGNIKLNGTGKFEIMIRLNQRVKNTHSSNLTVLPSEPTPTANQPAYYYLKVIYNKTSSSTPGTLVIYTPAGQRIIINSIS